MKLIKDHSSADLRLSKRKFISFWGSILIFVYAVGFINGALGDTEDHTGRYLVPTAVRPTKVTAEGIEYVNLSYTYRSERIDASLYLRALDQFDRRKNLPRQDTMFRALSPIVHHLFVASSDKDSGELTLGYLVVDPHLTSPEMYYNAAANNFLLLGYTANISCISKSLLQIKDQFSTLKVLHSRGSTLQMISYPADFMQPERNALIFHPGKTLEESVYEEKWETRRVSGLPSEAKSYEGKTHISSLYKVDPVTCGKGELIGFLVDAFTPPATETSPGVEDYIWVKEFFGTDSRFPKKIVVRPYNIKTPSEKELIRSSVSLREDQKENAFRPFATPACVPDLTEKTNKTIELLGFDPLSLMIREGRTISQPMVATSLPLYRSLIAIGKDGKPDTSLPAYRFDEPLRIMNVNWGFRYFDTDHDVVIINMP